ncbi:MAG: BolA/IbaG family iron-sulfur metabolism protein [Pseudomonadales bacterium]
MFIETRIREKLTAEFCPQHLAVENESHLHAVPADAETHFKVVVVAGRFEGLRPVARHQLVYAALAEQLAGPVHALALHTYTPDEWAARGDAPQSPECLGGSAREKTPVG